MLGPGAAHHPGVRGLLLHPEDGAADRGGVLAGLEVQGLELGDEAVGKGGGAGVCREGEGGLLGGDAGVAVAVEGGLFLLNEFFFFCRGREVER